MPPGVSGTVYSEFPDGAYINNLGGAAFLANVTGVFSLNSIYVCDPGTCPAAPTAIAVSNGDLDADGNVLTRLGAAQINDAGDVALNAGVQPGSSSSRSVSTRATSAARMRRFVSA